MPSRAGLQLLFQALPPCISHSSSCPNSYPSSCPQRSPHQRPPASLVASTSPRMASSPLLLPLQLHAALMPLFRWDFLILARLVAQATVALIKEEGLTKVSSDVQAERVPAISGYPTLSALWQDFAEGTPSMGRKALAAKEADWVAAGKPKETCWRSKHDKNTWYIPVLACSFKLLPCRGPMDA